MIEKEDKDKNIIKNNNIRINMEANEDNNSFIENNNENKLYIDSKNWNINGNGNTINHIKYEYK